MGVLRVFERCCRVFEVCLKGATEFSPLLHGKTVDGNREDQR